MAATWDEACEGSALAHGRPGVPVIAALLPLAATRNAKLGSLVRAVVEAVGDRVPVVAAGGISDGRGLAGRGGV